MYSFFNEHCVCCVRVARFLGLGGVGLLDPVTDRLRGDILAQYVFP